MIEPKLSNYGSNTRGNINNFYYVIKNFSSTMYNIGCRFEETKYEFITIIKRINRTLFKISEDLKNISIYEQILNQYISEFELSLDKIGYLNHVFGKDLLRQYKSIVEHVKKIRDKDQINKIRGLLTEALLCAFLYDSKQQSKAKLIWDVVFEINGTLFKHSYIDEEGKSKYVSSADIYYLNDFKQINLFESKTSPYGVNESKEQLEFLNKIQIEFKKHLNENIKVSVFLLEFKAHPTIKREIDDIIFHYNFSLIGCEDIKALLN
ncbi:hypothetical protein [Macrococcoides caseolyticum]|uniref:hypothetical protein n=1 Tax=Macrococcoides caseolyticum TaxID=69966 RepID=UPI0011AA655A|nr:hypothetical protein [Macrococcus caseolyticus]